MPTGERALIVGQINMDHPAAHRVVNGRLVGDLGYLNVALEIVIARHTELREGITKTQLDHELRPIVTFKRWEPGDTPREPTKLRLVE